MTAPTQEISRRSGLGGTDVSAIVGMNPYRSAWDVWAEKTGLLDDVIQETSSRAEWGKRLQKVIAEAYTEITGRRHTWIDKTIQHPTRAFQIYTPDAIAFDRNQPRGLDAKTAGLDQAPKWGDAGTEDIPEQYKVQAFWYLSATEYQAWDFALLLAGNDFRIYTILRDQETEGLLLEAAEQFWTDHILANKAPEMRATETAQRYLQKRFPRNSGRLRTPNADELALLEQYRDAVKFAVDADVRKENLEMRIKEAIGEDDGFQWNWNHVTYKRCKDTVGADWERLARWSAPEDLDRYTPQFTGILRAGSRRIHRLFKESK